MVFLVLLVIAAICINFILSMEMREIARAKGYDHDRYFHFCLWLGIVGYLVVIALPDLRAREQREALLGILRKQAAAECETEGYFDQYTNSEIQLPNL